MNQCPECGSTNLEWFVTNAIAPDGVTNGRLTPNDLNPIAYLGCAECSETVTTVDSDTIAHFLNSMRFDREHFIEDMRQW